MLIPAVYASTSGNVEIVVHTVAEVWKGAGHQVELHRAERTAISVFETSSTFLLATSTWEHGEINPFFRTLLKEFKHHSLVGKRAAFIGLGDTRYEPVLFTEGMQILKSTWEQQGGEVIASPLKINGEPYHLLSSTVTEWAQEVLPHLNVR